MYRGDYHPSDIVHWKFTTVNAAGAPTSLAGGPALVAYKDDSTSQSSAGITLTTDFDAVTGLHHVKVDTGADASFYSSGSAFTLVISAGTVDGQSVIGYVVGEFTIHKQAALRPTINGRTLSVESDGMGHADVKEVDGDADTLARFKRAADSEVLGTCDSGSGVTVIVTSSLNPAAVAVDQFKGRVVLFSKGTTTTALRGQGTRILSNTGAGVLTVEQLSTAPVLGDVFVIV